MFQLLSRLMSHRLTLAVAFAGAAGSLASTASAAPTQNVTYVALGDSFTAGPGINPQRPNTGNCLRSTQNYPSIIASQYWFGEPGTGDWNDYSCSSATTTNLTAQAQQAVNENVLGPSTYAVTFTIGGNDRFTTGHRSLWESLLNCVFSPTSPCQNDPALLKQSELTPQAFATRIQPAVQAIHAKAPYAKILIVSYPTIAPRAGQLGCKDPSPGHSWDLGMSEAAYLDGVTAKFLQMQKDAAPLVSAATGASVQVVDTYTSSANSHFCPSATSRGIQVPNVYNPGQLHPNVPGMTTTAALTSAQF